MSRTANNHRSNSVSSVSTTSRTVSRGPAAIPAASLPTHEQVAARAYDIYVRSGSQAGHCQENWLQAERELVNESIAKHNEEQEKGGIEEETEFQDEAEELGSSHLHLTYAGSGSAE
jgi:hypothetical protein